MKQKANVNECDVDHWSPIVFASNGGFLDVMEYLLNQNADLNLCSRFDIFPIHHAAREGFIEILDWLFQHGVDLESRNDHGRTAMFHAIYSGHISVFVFFLIIRNLKDTQFYCYPKIYKIVKL